jgi:hypothetical protein
MTTATVTINSLRSVSETQNKYNADIYLRSPFPRDFNHSVDLTDGNVTNPFPFLQIEETVDSFLHFTEKRNAANFPDIPVLEGLDINNPVLTDKIRILLNKFWAIVLSQALQSDFPINKAFVEVFRDPNEDRKKVSIKMFVEATAGQSVAFWEGLEDDIQELVKTLDSHNKLLFLRDISLRIHWK